jgi:hypothetical protein
MSHQVRLPQLRIVVSHAQLPMSSCMHEHD